MTPTIGRIVHVCPGPYSSQEICAGLITFVHSASRIDVTVFPGGGATPFQMTSVPLEPESPSGREITNYYWKWPDRP